MAITRSVSSNIGTSSDHSTLKCFWKKIWSIPVPHKIRHFVWRACRDALPTKSNLLTRKVIQEDICESCREASKTVGHVLWSYPKAKEVWECSKLVTGWNERANQTFQDLMWMLLLNGDAGEDKVAHAVTTTWAIWQSRNEVRYGGVRKSGQQISSWASEYLREYRVAVTQTAPGAPVPQQLISWSPPQNGHFKINVDGAVFSELKAVGVGVVIRDDKGRLEAALCRKITAPMGAVEAEAKAFEAGLLFAKDVGVWDVILEGDSLVVYNALCNISPPLLQ